MKIIRYILAFYFLKGFLLLGIDFSALAEKDEAIAHALGIQLFYFMLIGFYILLWKILFRKSKHF